MKILEEKKWWAFKCPNCKSSLEAEPEDVRCGEFGGDYASDGDERFYVECLKCGKYKFVPGNKLTVKIKCLAREKHSTKKVKHDILLISRMVRHTVFILLSALLIRFIIKGHG
ncbi:MAG: hypothetical protein Q8O83_00585 [bacterium]|nr:hypothetical protein [bacterium]